MEKFIVHGYNCNSLEQQTSNTCQYRAFAPDGHPVIITEYFIPEICTRQNDGRILIREQSSTLFKENLFQFVEKAKFLSTLNSDILPKPLDVFYENGTAYIVWQGAEGYFWQSYMKTQGAALSAQDRLALFLPLIRQLDQLAAQNIFYQFNNTDLIMRESGQIAINAMYSPDLSFASSLSSATHLIYFALVGADFPVGNASPAMRQNVDLLLNGQKTIHNFDRLYNLFHESLLFPNKVAEPNPNMPPVQNTIPTADPFSAAQKSNTPPPDQKTAIIITAIIVGSIFLLIIGLMISSSTKNQFSQAAVSAFLPYSSATASATNGIDEDQTTKPVIIEDEIIQNTIHQDADRNGDARIAYDRTIIPYEDQLIYRYWSEGWHLRKDNGTETTILADDVFPMFLTVADDYVYFSDAFKDYHIYRVPIEGGNPTLVLAQPVLSFGIYQDTVYYGNINQKYLLYQAPIGSSSEGTQVVDTTAYDIFVDPENKSLYFTDVDMAVYRLDLITNDAQILDNQKNYNIRFDNHTLYVVQENTDDTTSIYAYGIDGVKKNILDHITTYKYGVNNDYLYYTDYTTGTLNRQNLKTGEHSQITTDVNAYWINGIGSDLIYWYSAPNGELMKWSKESNIVAVDRGTGTFDYKPLNQTETDQLKEESAYGSNITNLAHGSSIVSDADGNLYFDDFDRATGDNGIFSIYNALYRYTPNGETSKISNSTSNSLFLQDNSIYYADYEGIKRVSIDSGKTNTIAELKASQIYPYQDKIYFSDSNGNLFAINFDGSQQAQLLTAEASSFVVYQDHIYFISKTDRKHVYWCDLDGLNKNPLIDLDVDSFSISNNKVYYVSENTVFVSELDGKNVKEIYSLDSSMRSPDIYVYKEWIYLMNGSGLSNNISRLRIDGTVYEPIFTGKELSSSSFSILNDKLYFSIDDYQNIGNHTFFRSDLNGDHIEQLIPDSISN